MGNIWTYAYDAAGHVTSATDPLDHTTTFEYDGWGNRTRSVDPNGLETVYEYDGHDNLIQQTVIADPADLTKNRVTRFSYNT
ncbi:MAG: RHS repeat domain-containing protein, partial [Desulfosalsimonadaceae bacterium]